ncbi:hypothetical protein SAMN06264364_106157 [Quadrisphaera granulorum]|uniref:Integral membrane protein n=1 Tax=Quadrisphaera granulorum TaxID=317664 RepID=A0A316AAK0_9ACTN|nr:hypothetical protein [Quadrisphaera granulorum]PWJ54713.1 hypothetical protein BXY45_106157 [Quadrisphaera granulorum]SZE96075.1 hypothetical protein SAMN06264364_106157 [Quadrisphaera granulorum]
MPEQPSSHRTEGAEGAVSPRGSGAMRHGPGRVLVAVYAVLGLSATVRGSYQVLFHFSEAPLAYLLSLFAGLVYVVATAALVRATPRAWQVALVAVLVELVGVLTVGTLTILDTADFPDGTVWGEFGRDYGWVPLLLPLLGLAWLRRTRPQ